MGKKDCPDIGGRKYTAEFSFAADNGKIMLFGLGE